MKDDKLGKLLNIPPMLPTVKEERNEIVETNPPENDMEQAHGDFDVAREAMLNSIEVGQDALDKLSDLAAGSQHPRAFEVLATMINTIGNMSKDLVNLHKQKKDLIQKPDDGPKTINNNLVISTNDLLKMIKGNNEPS
jgi:hypothetical protein